MCVCVCVCVCLTDSGADERGGVSDVVEAFLFDEVGHRRREVLVVSLHVILQDQTAQGTSGLICPGGEI